jgi:RNA polymerase sigma-70 factor (ECF subfamily)
MDESEFKNLYEMFSKPLWRYVVRLIRDSNLAEDFVQETFVRFLNQKHHPRSEPERKAYLYQTATHLVYDHWRMDKGRRVIRNFSEEPSVRERDPLEKLDFESAFDQLSPQHRTLLWMAYVECCRHDEIAEIMRIRPGSVKVQLFRAKRCLREIITKLENE